MRPIEDERRISVISATAAVKWYVIGILVTAVITIGGVLAAVYLAPNNAVVIPTIIGITSPIILTLLGLGQRAMAITQDGKLSRMLQVTEEKARLEGKIDGLTENPKTNL